MTAYSKIETIEALESHYGVPGEASIVKVMKQLTPTYAKLIEAAPFVALATSGPEGLDCSPRGDEGQVVFIEDEQTLLMPDRRGNNRIDSLRNIVRDPRVALMFLIPGTKMTIRVNGSAYVTTDPELQARFEVKGKQPRSVIVIKIEELYFQCARALLRSGIWDPEKFISEDEVPTAGDILGENSKGSIDAKTYDAEWAGRAAKTMW